MQLTDTTNAHACKHEFHGKPARPSARVRPDSKREKQTTMSVRCISISLVVEVPFIDHD